MRGEVEVSALRYVGEWEEYARFTGEIDGDATFRLPAPGYVAGTPAAGGQGNLQLNFKVREQGTGYVEQTSHLLTVADSPVNLQLIPASPWFSPGLPFSLLLVAETPGNEPVDTGARLHVVYVGQDLEPIGQESLEAELSGGRALVEVSPPADAVAMTVTADAGKDTPNWPCSPATRRRATSFTWSRPVTRCWRWAGGPPSTFIRLLKGATSTTRCCQGAGWYSPA